MRHWRQPLGPWGEPMSTGTLKGTLAAELTPQNYRYLQDHLYQESGIVLDANKHYLVESRLIPVLRGRGLSSLNELCAFLQKNNRDSLHREVVEAMTTNETSFFRDSALWQELRNSIMPELIAQRKDVRRLRFWSAASSGGQEAYSLSMLLQEMGLGGWDIKILGTDLSRPVLEKATDARYSQLEVGRGLPTPLLLKYFEREGLQWRVKQEVRGRVQFQPLDLRQPLRTFGPFDVVFCRNVLIYFDVLTKQKILTEIRGTIFRGGHMVLGSAETTLNLNLDNSFERRQIGQATFYRMQ